MLNYVEGYARHRNRVNKNFLEISYGSFKESYYLLEFSFKEGYLDKMDYEKLIILGDRIGAMIWGIISKIK